MTTAVRQRSRGEMLGWCVLGLAMSLLYSRVGGNHAPLLVRPEWKERGFGWFQSIYFFAFHTRLVVCAMPMVAGVYGSWSRPDIWYSVVILGVLGYVTAGLMLPSVQGWSQPVFNALCLAAGCFVGSVLGVIFTPTSTRRPPPF